MTIILQTFSFRFFKRNLKKNYVKSIFKKTSQQRNKQKKQNSSNNHVNHTWLTHVNLIQRLVIAGHSRQLDDRPTKGTQLHFTPGAADQVCLIAGTLELPGEPIDDQTAEGRRAQGIAAQGFAALEAQLLTSNLVDAVSKSVNNAREFTQLTKAVVSGVFKGMLREHNGITQVEVKAGEKQEKKVDGSEGANDTWVHVQLPAFM